MRTIQHLPEPPEHHKRNAEPYVENPNRLHLDTISDDLVKVSGTEFRTILGVCRSIFYNTTYSQNYNILDTPHTPPFPLISKETVYTITASTNPSKHRNYERTSTEVQGCRHCM